MTLRRRALAAAAVAPEAAADAGDGAAARDDRMLVPITEARIAFEPVVAPAAQRYTKVVRCPGLCYAAIHLIPQAAG